MQLSPNLHWLKAKLDDGLIGKLLQVDAFGKMDHRAGGEDMSVLGGHVFDLCRLFCDGDAEWCTARIMVKGSEVTLADVTESEGDHVGPFIGDEINAQFSMPDGVFLNYTSRAKQLDVHGMGGWGVILTGTQGQVRVSFAIPQVIQYRNRSADGNAEEWQPLAGDPTIAGDSMDQANQRLVDDLMAAIHNKQRNNQEGGGVRASAERAMKAQEMIMAVFQAGLTRTRVTLPLAQRTHPLLPIIP